MFLCVVGLKFGDPRRPKKKKKIVNKAQRAQAKADNNTIVIQCRGFGIERRTRYGARKLSFCHECDLHDREKVVSRRMH